MPGVHKCIDLIFSAVLKIQIMPVSGCVITTPTSKDSEKNGCPSSILGNDFFVKVEI